ncbi:MAG: DUF4747 family protein [Acidobacteria bacterium]|nr:DUF4747 family protein [Acidobacteriota bacterium]
MPKEQKIEIGALNITIHPHPSPEIYIDLFKYAFSLKHQVQLWGEIHGILRSVYAPDKKESFELLTGEITRFIKLKTDNPWFDLDKFDEADEEECQKIRIPENLRPNYFHIDYKLWPQKHIIFFETYHETPKLSPAMALRFFRRLFSHEKIIKKFGIVETTIIPQKEIVESILDSDGLKELHILITRPNADDLADAERELLDDLNNQHSKELRISQKAQSGKTIQPSQRTKILGRIASKNGVLSAKVRNDIGGVSPISTVDHPETKGVKYNPATETSTEAFRRAINLMCPPPMETNQ